MPLITALGVRGGAQTSLFILKRSGPRGVSCDLRPGKQNMLSMELSVIGCKGLDGLS